MSRLRISSPVAFFAHVLIIGAALLVSACSAPNTSTHDTYIENDAVAEVNAAGSDNSTFETNADAAQNTSTGDVSGEGDGYDANQDVVPGIGAFIYPAAMEVGEWYILEFTAGPNQAAVSAETEGLPTTPPKSIYVSRVMRVTLLGDAKFRDQAEE